MAAFWKEFGFDISMIAAAVVGFYLLILLCTHLAKQPPASVSEHFISYRLADGRHVSCRRAFALDCGVQLSICKDGHSYSCQLNVDEFPTPTVIE